VPDRRARADVEESEMRAKIRLIGLALAAMIVIAGAGVAYALWPEAGWTEEEKRVLTDLWIGSLPSLPADPSNAVADDPRAADLGHKLFFDTRMSSNGRVACATCHQTALAFTDGLALAQGVGTTDRKTPTIIGTAYSPWQFWDGRADSQWSQALGPLESPVEHASTRVHLVHLIAEHYRDEYESLFGPLPDLTDPERFPPNAGPVADPAARAAWDEMRPEDHEAVTRIYVNIGKAIAAYERRIVPGSSRFDAFVEALLDGDVDAMSLALSEDEVAGLRLFIGKGNCIECHSGPLLTNNDFHNVGVESVDMGRALGAKTVLAAEFNCLSQYSGAGPADCAELRFLKSEGHELDGAFKTPTLRLIDQRAPYMHAGQLATLEEVVDHYNRAPEASVGHTELEPLGLSETEIAQLVAFLRALDGPIDALPELLEPPRP
jgi:cytochrome c peroxidase